MKIMKNFVFFLILILIQPIYASHLNDDSYSKILNPSLNQEFELKTGEKAVINSDSRFPIEIFIPQGKSNSPDCVNEGCNLFLVGFHVSDGINTASTIASYKSIIEVGDIYFKLSYVEFKSDSQETIVKLIPKKIDFPIVKAKVGESFELESFQKAVVDNFQITYYGRGNSGETYMDVYKDGHYYKLSSKSKSGLINNKLHYLIASFDDGYYLFSTFFGPSDFKFKPNSVKLSEPKGTFLIVPPNHECESDIDCDDGDVSTLDKCLGVPRSCLNVEIFECISDDGYCPNECDHQNDNDCPILDLCSSDLECDDGNACTVDLCIGNPKDCFYNESVGCNFEGECISLGERLNEYYCNIDSVLLKQKEDLSFCDKDYECKCESCINNKCKIPGFLDKFKAWFRAVFSK